MLVLFDKDMKILTSIDPENDDSVISASIVFEIGGYPSLDIEYKSVGKINKFIHAAKYVYWADVRVGKNALFSNSNLSTSSRSNRWIGMENSQKFFKNSYVYLEPLKYGKTESGQEFQYRNWIDDCTSIADVLNYILDNVIYNNDDTFSVGTINTNNNNEFLVDYSAKERIKNLEGYIKLSDAINTIADRTGSILNLRTEMDSDDELIIYIDMLNNIDKIIDEKQDITIVSGINSGDRTINESFDDLYSGIIPIGAEITEEITDEEGNVEVIGTGEFYDLTNITIDNDHWYSPAGENVLIEKKTTQISGFWNHNKNKQSPKFMFKKFDNVTDVSLLLDLSMDELNKVKENVDFSVEWFNIQVIRVGDKLYSKSLNDDIDVYATVTKLTYDLKTLDASAIEFGAISKDAEFVIEEGSAIKVNNKNNVSVNTDPNKGMKVNDKNELYQDVGNGIKNDKVTGKLSINAGRGISIKDNKVEAKIGSGLSFDGDGRITASGGSGGDYKSIYNKEFIQSIDNTSDLQSISNKIIFKDINDNSKGKRASYFYFNAPNFINDGEEYLIFDSDMLILLSEINGTLTKTYRDGYIISLSAKTILEILDNNIIKNDGFKIYRRVGSVVPSSVNDRLSGKFPDLNIEISFNYNKSNPYELNISVRYFKNNTEINIVYSYVGKEHSGMTEIPYTDNDGYFNNYYDDNSLISYYNKQILGFQNSNLSNFIDFGNIYKDLQDHSAITNTYSVFTKINEALENNKTDLQKLVDQLEQKLNNTIDEKVKEKLEFTNNTVAVLEQRSIDHNDRISTNRNLINSLDDRVSNLEYLS